MKIKQEHLQYGLAIIKGWPGAEIGCPAVALPIMEDEHRIDAITQRGAARQGHVRGWVAKAGTALGPSNNFTGQAPPVAQHPGRRTNIAMSEISTHGT